MAEQSVFRLYSSCRFVRGGAFSAIYDLTRRLLFRFPASFNAVFERCENEGLDLQGLGQISDLARDEVVSALDFLRERELGRFYDAVSAATLAPLRERWDAPYGLLSAIVDVDYKIPDWSAVLGALDRQSCRALQVRCFSDRMKPEQVELALRHLRDSGILRVEFLVNWSEPWNGDAWLGLFEAYRNLHVIRIFAAPEDKVQPMVQPALRGRVARFETRLLTGPDDCGSIMPQSLAMPSTGLFSELKQFNGCLNRKLSIRSNGQICNCPAMARSFGDDLGKLDEIIASADFRAPWTIRKDEIEVCSGCEFRYVCTDCRAHLGDDLSRSKPARCGYDPVTGQWAESASSALELRRAHVGFEVADV